MAKTPKEYTFLAHVKKNDIYRLSIAQKIGMIKKGVSKNDLNEIKTQTGLDYDVLSDVLSVSRAKLINKKGNEKFDQVTSERIMLLADVVAYGQEVFEDHDRLNAWLRKPAIALGGATPLAMMDTLYGIQEIKKELGRIEHGVY